MSNWDTFKFLLGIFLLLGLGFASLFLLMELSDKPYRDFCEDKNMGLKAEKYNYYCYDKFQSKLHKIIHIDGEYKLAKEVVVLE